MTSQKYQRQSQSSPLLVEILLSEFNHYLNITRADRSLMPSKVLVCESALKIQRKQVSAVQKLILSDGIGF